MPSRKLRYTKKAVSLSELKPHPKNIRVHTELQLVELEKSLTMFGQYRDVVTDEKGMILAGHGIVEAMKRLGNLTANVVQISGMSEQEKIKLVLADNKTQSLGIDDWKMLEGVLRDMDDFDIPGFDGDAIRTLFENLDDIQFEVTNVESTSNQSNVELGSMTKPTITCPKCKAEFNVAEIK